jgi:hypothetical protein
MFIFSPSFVAADKPHTIKALPYPNALTYITEELLLQVLKSKGIPFELIRDVQLNDFSYHKVSYTYIVYFNFALMLGCSCVCHQQRFDRFGGFGFISFATYELANIVLNHLKGQIISVGYASIEFGDAGRGNARQCKDRHFMPMRFHLKLLM